MIPSEYLTLTNVALCFRASRAEGPASAGRGHASSPPIRLAGSAAMHLGALTKMESGRAIVYRLRGSLV